MYRVYVLHSDKFYKFYVGQTDNLKERIISHNIRSTNSYTSKYRPWSVFFVMKVESRSSAMKIEAYLKKKPRSFIKRLPVDKDLVLYIRRRFELSRG